MSQAENFFAAFPGKPQSPLYGKPLTYVRGLGAVGDDRFMVLNPNTDIAEQLALALNAQFKFVELAAPDMRLGEFMMLLTHIHGLGLGVIAKNAAAYASPYQYLSHPNVFGCVVERGEGQPRRYDALRRDVRKDGLLPVWFVFDGASNADQCADEIRLYDLKGMGVSYAAGLSGVKYEDSHTVLNPIL